jgi:hypothetical protein
MRQKSTSHPRDRQLDRSWNEPQRGASTNTYLLALLVLAVIVALAIVFFGGEGEQAEDADSARSAAAVVLAPGERLDPALYRTEIEALEATLYRVGTADATTARHIHYAARRLADAVLDERETAAPRAARAITSFADGVLQPDDVGFATLDLPATRGQWTQLRGRLFRPADWFAGGAASGPAVRSGPDTKEASVNDLRRLVETVTDLINSGRDETGYFGEIGVDVEEMSNQAASLRSDWEEWARGWSQRVETVAASLPVRTAADAQTELVEAHRQLSTAIHQLRLVAMTDSATGVPPRAERQRYFDAAQRAVGSARSLLSVL